MSQPSIFLHLIPFGCFRCAFFEYISTYQEISENDQYSTQLPLGMVPQPPFQQGVDTKLKRFIEILFGGLLEVLLLICEVSCNMFQQHRFITSPSILQTSGPHAQVFVDEIAANQRPNRWLDLMFTYPPVI